MPKISVIIPVYRVESFVERCTTSLFSQTLDDIEFIFIDDCTPDNSMSIIRNQIERYRSRIEKYNWSVRLEKMSVNSGQAVVRRYGISLATGDYIIHCDSDDWVNSDMYKIMYDEAITKKSDVVICDYQTVDNINNVLKVYSGCIHTDKTNFLEDCFCGQSSWSLCNKLFRKNLYDNIELYPKSSCGEDMVLTIQLLFSANLISYINIPFYNYYSNPDSITRSITRDIILKRFNDSVANLLLLDAFLSKRIDFKNYVNQIVYLKYKQKCLLRPFLQDASLYALWKNTFPEINRLVMFNSNIKIRDKIRFYLNLFKILKH